MAVREKSFWAENRPQNKKDSSPKNCKGHPIQELSPSFQEFRLYNSLAVTAYWNESDSIVPELLNGEELLSYENMIREKIQASLKSCPEKGLAEYLFSELLKKRVASMTPDVEEYAGRLWGVLTVRTYGELNDRELTAMMEEWKAMADSGWGEELFTGLFGRRRGRSILDSGIQTIMTTCL